MPTTYTLAEKWWARCALPTLVIAQSIIVGLFRKEWPAATTIYDASSRPRGAADIDHVAVANRGVLVGKAGDQHAAIERDDLAVLFAADRARRADVILAARAAL